MTTQDRIEGKKRSELLTTLRKQHPERVKIAQTMLKEQRSIRKALQQILETKPHTIPQLAEASGFPAHQVLWYISVMKKYGKVVETELDEDYEFYLYGLTKETEK
ncbi:MAG: hypothetical protein J7L57_03335 [Deltaproteobacteria bacterium]|nr:hypothetical protein [Candidatus Tharpella sp.]